MMGRVISEIVRPENNTMRIDLSKLTTGVYNMTISYENKQYSKRIIKQ